MKIFDKLFFTLFFALLLFFCGCSDRAQKNAARIGSMQDWNSSKFILGTMTGIAAAKEARARLPKAEIREYIMPIDAFTAICGNKIDAVVLDRPTLEFMSIAHPELAVMNTDLAVGHISVAAAKSRLALMRKVNEFIRLYRRNGTYQQMYTRWFRSVNPAMPELPAPVKSSGILKIGVTANNEPLCFLQNGTLAGFDSEFALRCAAFLNCTVKFVDMPYDALVPGLQSGKIDLAVAYMDAEPEREESVLFSESYIDAPITLLTRREMLKKELLPKKEQATESASFFVSMQESFEKTFLRESRWKLILEGLGTTLVITFFAVLLGTGLAFGICMMCRSRKKLPAWIGEQYVSLITGTPILVILMILYYVVFAKVDIHGIFVAILAFALDFAAYSSVTLRSGIEAVPEGQMEAALALGHTPSAAFMRFVLPQAVRLILPVYRNEIITTLKATSIVGYIAIMDLTKMGDIIRSRTYEAFFPLIAIALIYFLAAKCLTALLLIWEKRLNPENHRNLLMRKAEKAEHRC